MTANAVNIHATAIVVGQTGLLFVGPSGAGKSITAFDCLAASRRAGSFSALIADDQVFLSGKNGIVTATCPEAIAGLIEIRGSGIARVPHIQSAPLHLAVGIIGHSAGTRLPPENQTFDIPGIGSLPHFSLARDMREPLAIIAAFYPELGLPVPL